MDELYGRHNGMFIAMQRNAGRLQEDEIVWGMDLVPYQGTGKPPRHARSDDDEA